MSFWQNHITLRAKCPLCDCGNRRFLYKKENHVIKFADSFFKCENCGFIYSEATLTASGVDAFYKEKYLNSNYTKYSEFYDLKLTHFKTRLREIIEVHKNKNPGLSFKKMTLLDLGCGTGVSMIAAKELGLDVTGVEISQEAAARANANQVGRVYCSNLDELDKLNLEQFDLIMLFDILDHVADPLKVLKSASALLKPGGTMFMDVCNIESVYAKLMGKYYTHVIPYEHFSYFSPTTLKMLVRKCGLIPDEPADLKRPVSLAFLATTLQEFNPLLGKIFAPVLKLVPKFLQMKLFFIPVGVMTLAAHKPGNNRA